MKTQFRKAAVAAAMALSFAGVAGSANAAQSYSFDFGSLLSGSYQPGSTFASLSVTSTDDLTFTFSLTTYDLNSIFTSGAYIDKAIFNTTTGTDPTSLTFLSGGVSGVTLDKNAPNVGSIAFDFGANLPNPLAGRLTANEQANWSVTFSSAQTSPFFADPGSALHVAALSTAQGGSAWYTPSAPVPEPETYAMLLAGIGLVGAIARRRKVAR